MGLKFEFWRGLKFWAGLGPRYRWGSQTELGMGSGLSLKLRSIGVGIMVLGGILGEEK